eukprot:6189980-Pleurochrysis_carterae.AAC.1
MGWSVTPPSDAVPSTSSAAHVPAPPSHPEGTHCSYPAPYLAEARGAERLCMQCVMDTPFEVEAEMVSGGACGAQGEVGGTVDGGAEGTPGGGADNAAAADGDGAEGTPGGNVDDAAADYGGGAEGTPGGHADDGEGGADEGESAGPCAKVDADADSPEYKLRDTPRQKRMRELATARL